MKYNHFPEGGKKFDLKDRRKRAPGHTAVSVNERGGTSVPGTKEGVLYEAAGLDPCEGYTGEPADDAHERPGTCTALEEPEENGKRASATEAFLCFTGKSSKPEGAVPTCIGESSRETLDVETSKTPLE